MADHNMTEARAQSIVDARVSSEEMLRELLILCWHSSKVADQFFLSHTNCAGLLVQLAEIAIDEKDYQGDAPPAAAYYLEKLPPSAPDRATAIASELLWPHSSTGKPRSKMPATSVNIEGGNFSR